MLGQINHLLTHAARIKHAGKCAAAHRSSVGKQQRGDHHFISIVAQYRSMTFAHRHQRLVVADDGTRVAAGQLRAFRGTPETGNQHRYRLRVRLLQGGNKCRHIAHRLQ